MRAAEPGGETVTLTVERVGQRGDGIAYWRGEPVFLPFTAPGDQLRARLLQRRSQGWSAEVEALLVPGARTQPACRHFGTCGGCALQHLDGDAYAAAKLSWLDAALAHQGLSCSMIHPLRRLTPGTRRRARLQLARGRAGFHARQSHRLIDLAECAVIAPPLFGLLAPLRRLSHVLFERAESGAVNATLSETGIDLVIELPHPPDLRRLEALAAFAAAENLAQLSWRCGAEVALIARWRQPRVTLACVAVDLPPDAFLQPSLEAEAALGEAVLAMAGEAGRIADLYAGLGTFAFALAAKARVHAVEGSEASVAALARAAARAGLSSRVSAERRDLAARPLDAEDLARFDAVVFDPPYTGAREQSAALAASRVPRIVAVSCNPASFARDARLLADGGYGLVEVRPFDAFIWSANLELAALFERR
ncbi:MAG: class I SAM-dependent RNA methyltransferase [Stellaceae bacterium]